MREALAAPATRVQPLSRVCALVHLEVAHVGEALAALGAVVATGAAVTAQVLSQDVFAGEPLAALQAVVGALTRRRHRALRVANEQISHEAVVTLRI